LSKRTVALCVAPKRGIQRGARERFARVDELNETHQAMPGAKVHQPQAYMSMKVAREFARLHAELLRQFPGSKLRPQSNSAEGPTHKRMAPLEVLLRVAEDITHNALMIMHARGRIQTEQLLPQLHHFVGGQLKRARLGGQWPPQTPRRKFRCQGDNDELQILRSLQHFMVLARTQQQHLSRIHLEDEVPDAHPCPSTEDQVQFRLSVEVTGSAKRRPMEPCLSTMPGQHGEWLIDRRHRAKA